MSLDITLGKAVSHGAGLRTYIGQMYGTPNFDRPSLMPRGTNRKLAVADELKRVHNEAKFVAQPGLDKLRAEGLVTHYEFNPFSNTVIVDVPDSRAAEAWSRLNKVEGMGRIVRNREVKLAPFEAAKEGAALVGTKPNKANPAAKVEWNVSKVGADQVWAQGVKGDGVVVGIIDTGVDVKHPALASKYRGMNADGTMNNDYNFFDAINGRTVPYDDNMHGSHVAGTVLGGTADYTTGMAPNAKWISSKILSGQGSGTLESVTKGLEWMLAPRDAAGNNPDPTKAPDVVNNSWGTNNGRLTAFQNIWKAFIAAGIEPVAAAGNSGPRPSTVGAPGSYPESVSVAATDKDDKIASFSSRGPSPLKGADGSDKKPDVAAPGKDVVSSVPGGGYRALSGTSMATPGVTGVIALLLSKHKDLTHDEVQSALRSSAVDLGNQGYDYDYGYGRVDAAKALAAADALVASRPKA